MGTVSYTQSISIKSGRTPDNAGQIIQKDFEINPAETTQITEWNENLTHRFSIPANSTTIPLSIGTLNEIKVLVVKPDSEITLNLINSNGTSQDLVFAANRISIMHVSLIGLSASNPTSVPIKGVYYIAGD